MHTIKNRHHLCRCITHAIRCVTLVPHFFKVVANRARILEYPVKLNIVSI
ncbi:hypothetical protein Hanom_Chr04g00372761 [Helianthus anomalus]